MDFFQKSYVEKQNELVKMASAKPGQSCFRKLPEYAPHPTNVTNVLKLVFYTLCFLSIDFRRSIGVAVRRSLNLGLKCRKLSCPWVRLDPGGLGPSSWPCWR